MYKLSKDYKKLYELVKAGNKIACYVDYRFSNSDKSRAVCRDICEAALSYGQQKYIEVGARGMEYSTIIENEEEFIRDCNRMNLEWIDPLNL